MSRNASAMASSILKPQAMPFIPSGLTSIKPLPSHHQYQSDTAFLESRFMETPIQSYVRTQATSLPVPGNLKYKMRLRRSSSVTEFRLYTEFMNYAGPTIVASPTGADRPIPEFLRKPINKSFGTSKYSFPLGAKDPKESSLLQPAIYLQKNWRTRSEPKKGDYLRRNWRDTSARKEVDYLHRNWRVPSESAGPRLTSFGISYQHIDRKENPKVLPFFLRQVRQKGFMQRIPLEMAFTQIELPSSLYGQWGESMENYLSRGVSFEGRPCIKPSQFYRDLESTPWTKEERAKLLEAYIKRPCTCNSTTCCRLTIS